MMKKQLYESDSVDLRIREVIPVSFFNRSPKSIVYSIYRHGDDECIGECDLRFGMALCLSCMPIVTSNRKRRVSFSQCDYYMFTRQYRK